MTTISLVIPAYNESKLLPRLLGTVDVAREEFAGGPDNIEVIVADNASTDETAAIASARGCKVASVQKRSIAAARNGGARLANGEILCFVDADMRIHPSTFNKVVETLDDGRFVAGSTGGTFERWSTGIALTYAVVKPALILFRIDTGVVFCRREDFDTVGGYDECRPIGEDVAFLMALRALGRTRRQRLVRIPKVGTIISTRKFDQHGDWHFLRMMPMAMLAAIRPSVSTRIANRFWYNDDR